MATLQPEVVQKAQQALAALTLSEKNRAFLERALQMLENKPIQQIEVYATAKGGMIVVFYDDGDRREFAAG